MTREQRSGWIKVNEIRLKWYNSHGIFYTFGESSVSLEGLRRKIKLRFDAAGVNFDSIKRRIKPCSSTNASV